jgi:hypothetical protein
MPSAVDNLKSWFDKLSQDDKRRVIDFLYGTPTERAKAAQAKDITRFSRGLFLGPAPSSAVCDRCGRPY